MTNHEAKGAQTRADIRWILREGNLEDAEGILECRQRTFSGEDLEKQERKYWEYEFIRNHAGPAYFFVASDGDQIVGHYAIIPQYFFLNGDRHIGSIVVDVMTDPDYRYQGMFVALGRYALSYATEKTNMEFTTGYPIRPEVLPGHLKTGWVVNFPMNAWVMPLFLDAILKRRFPLTEKIPGIFLLTRILGSIVFRSFSWLQLLKNSTYRVERLTRCDVARFNAFWDRFKASAPPNCLIQERTAEYLSWRYDSNPSRNYTYHIAVDQQGDMAGFIVTRIASLMNVSAMVLVDALFLPGSGNDAVRGLIRDVRQMALANMCSMCAVMVNQPNLIFPSPWKYGFFPTPYRFKLITRELTENSVVQNPGLQWHLMWGDTDDL
jgi:hypothetical protein